MKIYNLSSIQRYHMIEYKMVSLKNKKHVELCRKKETVNPAGSQNYYFISFGISERMRLERRSLGLYDVLTNHHHLAPKRNYKLLSLGWPEKYKPDHLINSLRK